jgi:SAM-dependent methyltransferase
VGRGIVVLDARPRADFVRGHAPGAANLPFDQWDERAAELPPRDATILLHGGNADALRARGFADVRAAAGDLTEVGPPRVVAWRPARALERCAARLPTEGRALDVACGAGRDATWLATRGLTTLGIDILPDALRRARRLARASFELAEPPRVPVHFACADASRPLPCRENGFVLVCGLHYLDRALFIRAREWLVPGGYILWQTFSTRTPPGAHPRRPAFRLETGELESLCRAARFDVQETWQDGVEDGVLAIKPA